MSADLTIPLILIAHKALEMGPRKYPAADEPRDEEPRDEEPPHERDAAEFFAAEQCPADSNFR